MKKTDISKIEDLTSLKFLVIVLFFSLIIFNFLDIFIYELTRNLPKIIFSFFQNIIDPFSDIVDPLNIIILCLIIIFLNSRIHLLIKNKKKCKLLEEKTGLSSEEILNSFTYYSTICKHWFWSLSIAGIICNIMKYIIGVSRPKYFLIENYERINFFNLEHKVSSFPSGHTQAAFTLALLLIIYTRNFTLIIVCIACLMGISRIFMSMHFPSDIFFGAYLGAVIPILLYKLEYKKKLKLFEKTKIARFKEFLKLIYWKLFI
tara:strand:- start:426 stop:1208 length:783 start_codon:yes stop_codon:yes gene_type:complete